MFTMACLQNSSLQQSNLCACGKVIHNSHSYCKMPKRGKSSTVLRFWVKNTNPAELSVKIKDCWTYESVTNYLCEKAKFRSLGKKLPSDKEIQSQPLVTGHYFWLYRMQGGVIASYVLSTHSFLLQVFGSLPSPLPY